MAKLIRMPEISANLTSAVIKEWFKKEGDSVAVGEPLAGIETEKALIDFDAVEAGIIGRILVSADQDVDVGTPIAVMLFNGDTAADIDALLAASGTSRGRSETRQAPTEGAHTTEIPILASGSTTSSEKRAGRIFASPLARRMAKNLNLDLSVLKGSGPHGRLVKRDIDGARPSVKPPMPAIPPDAAIPTAIAKSLVSSSYEDIPHSSMRKTIARRLTESKTTIPHFYLKAQCRVDKLSVLRAEVNRTAPSKFSVNDFIIKAVAAALRALPEMNVSWTDAALRRYAQADISVAVSTDSGLLTPVVRAADTKTLSVISAEVADLATRARNGKLAPDEYQGGSFTISNLGMFGVQEFSAIINPPQSAILAVGAIMSCPVVENGGIIVASVMTVTLAVDHRAIDGALAAQWLGILQRTIENPITILI